MSITVHNILQYITVLTYFRITLRNGNTHIDFTQDDVNDAADEDDKVKDVPRVSKVTLGGRKDIVYKRYLNLQTLQL